LLEHLRDRQKEFRHLSRDTGGAADDLMPVVQLLIYGFAIDNRRQAPKHRAAGRGSDPNSRRLVQAFAQSTYFDIKKEVHNPLEFAKRSTGVARRLFCISSEFRQRSLRRPPAKPAAVVDERIPRLEHALNTGVAIVQAFVQKKDWCRSGSSDRFPRADVGTTRTKSAYFFVPGLVGLLIMSSFPVPPPPRCAGEKKRQNIEQLW